MLPYLIASRLRRRLLAHYFTHPDEKYYVREIATILNLDPGNLSREFRRLTQEGLFQEEQKGRIKLYGLNRHFPLYGELKQIIFKTEGVEGGLRDLADQFSKIKLGFIYGSYAKGEERASSDIDVVFVGKPDTRKLTLKIRELEERLRREINFNLYTESEFEKGMKEGGFLTEVVRGPKIILKGPLNA